MKHKEIGEKMQILNLVFVTYYLLVHLVCLYHTILIITLTKTSTRFHVSTVQVCRKHWKKEKLLVTSNFSFSHSVFYPLEESSTIFIQFQIVVCKFFQFGRVLICRLV